MKTQAIILAFAAVFAATANAATRDDAMTYGQSVPSATSGRVIEITPRTRFVNVTNGETVTFEEGTQRFTWHVDTYNNVIEFDLDKILPKEMQVANVGVYVAPDEYYQQ